MQKGFTEPVTSIEPKTLDLSERHNAVRNSRGGGSKITWGGETFFEEKKNVFHCGGFKIIRVLPQL